MCLLFILAQLCALAWLFMQRYGALPHKQTRVQTHTLTLVCEEQMCGGISVECDRY